MKQLKTAVVVLGVMTLLLGVVYPLAVTGIAQLLFPFRANGSLISPRLRVPASAGLPPVGSALIGQQFSSPGHFRGRPSDCGYDGVNSSSSNLGPSNPTLFDSVRARVRRESAPRDPDSTLDIRHSSLPADLVLSSASGLDPDISPEAALFQVTRVARERGLDTAAVRNLLTRNVQPPFLGIFSVSRVNVLRLNLALDSISGGINVQ
jgi:potassium-transporting ATPase KdpC subunit